MKKKSVIEMTQNAFKIHQPSFSSLTIESSNALKIQKSQDKNTKITRDPRNHEDSTTKGLHH